MATIPLRNLGRLATIEGDRGSNTLTGGANTDTCLNPNTAGGATNCEA